MTSPDLCRASVKPPLSFLWQFFDSLTSRQVDPHLLISPLHFAVGFKNVRAVKMLLAYGAEVDQVAKELPITPLHLAIDFRSYAIVELLLESGASLESRNYAGRSCANMMFSLPLGSLPDSIRHKAAKLVQPDVYGSFLVLFSDPNGRIQNCTADRSLVTKFDRGGFNEISKAFEVGFPERATYLLNLDVDLTLIDPAFGGALHKIWLGKQLSTLRHLLRKLGPACCAAMLNFKHTVSHTPLYYAAAASQLEVMSLLLRSGADINLVGGPEGTAVMISAAYGREDAVKFLVRLGASTSYVSDDTGAMISIYDKAKGFPAIQRWLLVERWQETRTIQWI